MFLFLFLLVMCLRLHGVTGVDTEVSVMEGDSVTLNTGVQTNQQDIIRWYFNGILIALITGDLSDICTDVQCDKGNGRFRGRLKLDHQTGSLTITHTRNTDAGLYELKLISSSSISEKIFSVTVYEKDHKSVNEGESVTFDPGVVRNQNDVMRWYFNEILIAEITGDQSNICKDEQCNERFRNRLRLDHLTGALTVFDIRNTDSGDYDLKIRRSSSRRINSAGSVKRFGVTVNVPGSGLSSGAVAGIVVAVILLLVAAAAAAGVIYYRKHFKIVDHAVNNQNDVL